MKNIKLRIYAKAVGLQIALIVAMRFLMPLLANYPPFSETTAFQNEVEAMTHNQQYLMLGSIFIITQIILIHFIFKKIFRYLGKDKKKVTKSEVEEIRQLCFKIPIRLLISQSTMLLAMLMVLFSLVSASIALYFKFIIIYFAFFTAGWVLITTLLQNELDRIVESTYKINKNATIPEQRTKFYISLLKSLVPFFMVIMVAITLLQYSKIIDLNGESRHSYYKKTLGNIKLDGLTIDQVRSELKNIDLFDNNNYYFIISNNGDYFSKPNGYATDFFKAYAKHFIKDTDGRIYEYYGIEEEAYAKQITLRNGETALVGIKYTTSSTSVMSYLVITVITFTIFYFIILLLWTKNISKNITRVSDRLSQIAKKYDVDNDVSVLPVLSNDEIGELVMSFNEIRQLTKENVEKIRNSQDILMERERLATLGQMVGGIAHNLKTPIMSIAGAMEGLEDLIKEYEHSIDDPEVTIQDHHAIAKDMKEWVEKVNSYDAYMSDIINTVKGQAVNFNEVSMEEFTIDELLKRVNILMKHELKNALAVLAIDCKVPVTTTLRGNVNSLVQIVNNLISNAIQAYDAKQGKKTKSLIGKNNPENEKHINLIISQEGNEIIISVQDFATGIPKDVQEKLFKSMVTTKGHNGTGLGLFMSYSTIKGHFNGDMNFTSEVGKGTTFNIILPL